MLNGVLRHCPPHEPRTPCPRPCLRTDLHGPLITIHQSPITNHRPLDTMKTTIHSAFRIPHSELALAGPPLLIALLLLPLPSPAKGGCPPPPVSVAAGNWHSLAVKSDGTVWAWGTNSVGELGDGTTTSCDTPVQVSGLSGVVAVAGGSYHNLALKSDGTVWAWGWNVAGELGDGTTAQRDTPVQVSSLSGVLAVAAGNTLSLAVRSDGTVWAWAPTFTASWATARPRSATRPSRSAA